MADINPTKLKASPKDVFLHILSIVTLYTSAVSFTNAVFDYINLWFPDPLNSYERISSTSDIRWWLAVLIVVFPVYILTNWFLGKDYARDPEKRNLRVRKWLVYLTLFVAALIIIGDLVSLVFNLLNGEITVRFILKIVTVLFVAGSIFAYYFWDLKRHGNAD